MKSQVIILTFWIKCDIIENVLAEQYKKGVITLKQGERSFQFKKHYIQMRSEGMSVQKIADYYHLSQRHAYNLIHDLAEKMRIPYESLLNRPHCTHIIMGSGKTVQPVKRIDFSIFEKEFREEASAFEETLNHMDKVLKEWRIMPSEL